MDAENDEDDEGDDDDDPVTEIRFVPSDMNQLDQMFAVMSDCQALHPDSDEDNLSDDFEGEDEEEEDAAAAELAGECPTEDEMTPQGLATLRRLEGMLGGGGGASAEEGAAQFEDA